MLRAPIGVIATLTDKGRWTERSTLVHAEHRIMPAKLVSTVIDANLMALCPTFKMRGVHGHYTSLGLLPISSRQGSGASRDSYPRYGPAQNHGIGRYHGFPLLYRHANRNRQLRCHAKRPRHGFC